MPLVEEHKTDRRGSIPSCSSVTPPKPRCEWSLKRPVERFLCYHTLSENSREKRGMHDTNGGLSCPGQGQPLDVSLQTVYYTKADGRDFWGGITMFPSKRANHFY